MSFDFPASVERDIERYAQDEHISSAEAVVQLVRDALKAKKRNAANRKFTEADLETLRRNVPIFAFLEKLPDGVLDGIQAATNEIRAEGFTPRG